MTIANDSALKEAEQDLNKVEVGIRHILEEAENGKNVSYPHTRCSAIVSKALSFSSIIYLTYFEIVLSDFGLEMLLLLLQKTLLPNIKTWVSQSLVIILYFLLTILYLSSQTYFNTLMFLNE